MTYLLNTLKGEIEAGFCGVKTYEVRMGELSIFTHHFCDFVAKLAAGRNSVKVQTLGVFRMVEVNGSWDPERKVVILGAYEIRGDDFGPFADYVFNGGFLGWDPNQPDWKPDFVKEAISYVREHMSEIQGQPHSYLRLVPQEQLPSLEGRL